MSSPVSHRRPMYLPTTHESLTRYRESASEEVKRLQILLNFEAASRSRGPSAKLFNSWKRLHHENRGIGDKSTRDPYVADEKSRLHSLSTGSPHQRLVTRNKMATPSPTGTAPSRKIGARVGMLTRPRTTKAAATMIPASPESTRIIRQGPECGFLSSSIP